MNTRHTEDDDEAESAETINGLAVRKNQGSTFDPENHRLFSILPDCDADEAYCVRHDREMVAVKTGFHFDGAIYATADDFDIWTCPHCAREVGPAAKRLFRERVAWSFATYNDTDEEFLDSAFQYVGEAGDFGGEGE